MVLAGVLGTLALRALVDIHRFYHKVSQQSRELGSATMVLDRLEAFAFGLPRQAFTLGSPANGQPALAIQPQSALAASGTAIYSSTRQVLQNSPEGVWLWSLEGESPVLGAAPAIWPPAAEKARRNLLLGPGWTFDARLDHGGFPLRLTVTPPSPGSRPFQKDIEGYL
jgi:hypothetical protein